MVIVRSVRPSRKKASMKIRISEGRDAHQATCTAIGGQDRANSRIAGESKEAAVAWPRAAADAGIVGGPEHLALR